ncbi:GntR family transcriptional regulator [Dactylosporangium darangshiense]|uniref:GntR family transcriptional regulator n=1 Tax=Dactylosporangium darangshiense TaxID=579108 RepID=UPI0031EA2C10
MSVVGSTRAGSVYDQLRADLLTSRILPGTKLKLVALAERHEVSMSVIREALSRLSAEGLVVATPQRGFRVISLSDGDLIDLTNTRVDIECLAARRAVEHGDLAWETGLVAAHHALDRTPTLLPDGGVNENWIDCHRDFHSALLAGCGSPRLQGIAAALRDAAELYRVWSQTLAHDDTRDIAAEHRQLTNLAVARDADGLTAALAAHIQRTTDALLRHTQQ